MNVCACVNAIGWKREVCVCVSLQCHLGSGENKNQPNAFYVAGNVVEERVN